MGINYDRYHVNCRNSMSPGTGCNYFLLVSLQDEVAEIVKIGYLNGLFVLARSIGLIGHALDQKRLQQPLYRHPWDEVLYI